MYQCGYELVGPSFNLRLVNLLDGFVLFVICSLHCIAFLVFHDEILASNVFGNGDST